MQHPANNNGIQNGINNNVKNNNLGDMLGLTPAFYGLDNMLKGLREMVRGGPNFKKNKLKEMTMITPTFKETEALEAFFQPSPKIPINFMPSAALNKISSNGWIVKNDGLVGAPIPQSDLGFPNPIAGLVTSSFGDNTLTNPNGIY